MIENRFVPGNNIRFFKMNAFVTAIDLFLIRYYCDINSLFAIYGSVKVFRICTNLGAKFSMICVRLILTPFVTRVIGVMNYVMTRVAVSKILSINVPQRHYFSTNCIKN